jgi:hypothetical protein
MPVTDSDNTTSIPTFTITVNGTGPEWFYCAQAKHCQSGMVFAINPTSEKTLAGFKANCANATENIAPNAGGAISPPPSSGSQSQLPTQPSLPTSTSSAQATSLPIQTGSLASSTISRTASWVVLGLAGCVSFMML